MHREQLPSNINDTPTDLNTVLLQKSRDPEVQAKNRKLCREHGVKESTQELRRLQHFVSQEIIKLLTKHNITQQNGKPYVSSSPKGFLQGPNEWLVHRGYYLSGWPRGLPKGSISIWASHYTYALAAMFIMGTITLKPLPESSQTQYQSDSLAPSDEKRKRLSVSKRIKSRREVHKQNLNESDRDAEGSPDEACILSYVPRHINSPTQWKNEAPSTPQNAIASRSATDLTNLTGHISSAFDESKYFDGSSVHEIGPAAIGLLAAAAADFSATPKRKIDESYFTSQEVPSDATVNWVPPVSATRGSKRAKTS